MEPHLGADLSGVRVHTGGDSAKAASAFGARAFTVGSDVHFNAGEFAPGSKEGDKLLAHELTHVVQGQKSGIQRKVDDDGAEVREEADVAQPVSDPSEPAEKEADSVAEDVAANIHDGEEADAQGGAQNGSDTTTASDQSRQKKAALDEKKLPNQAPAPIAAKLAPGVVFRAAQNPSSTTTSFATSAASNSAATNSSSPQAPAKPKVVFDSITLTPPMAGGNERLQVRPTNPGADGKAELWVANQPGAKRFTDIHGGPLGSAIIIIRLMAKGKPASAMEPNRRRSQPPSPRSSRESV
jgi:hypothetical protein